MGVEEKLQDELEAVKRVRDELRVRIHLGKAEVRDLWEATEAKLEEVESKLRRTAASAEEPLQDVGDAAKLLLDEIRDGFHRIRGSL